MIADPAPVLRAVVGDVLAAMPPDVVAARFHRAVADLVVVVAERLRDADGLTHRGPVRRRVPERAAATRLVPERACEHGFRVLRHRRVPPSDAGLALGQLRRSRARMRTRRGVTSMCLAVPGAVLDIWEKDGTRWPPSTSAAW